MDAGGGRAEADSRRRRLGGQAEQAGRVQWCCVPQGRAEPRGGRRQRRAPAAPAHRRRPPVPPRPPHHRCHRYHKPAVHAPKPMRPGRLQHHRLASMQAGSKRKAARCSAVRSPSLSSPRSTLSPLPPPWLPPPPPPSLPGPRLAAHPPREDPPPRPLSLPRRSPPPGCRCRQLALQGGAAPLARRRWQQSRSVKQWSTSRCRPRCRPRRPPRPCSWVGRGTRLPPAPGPAGGCRLQGVDMDR